MALFRTTGLKCTPCPLKNLFWNSTQCRRRVCSAHSNKSIIISTKIVAPMNTKNPKKSASTEPLWKPGIRQLSKNTLASCEWARDRAQRRK